MHALSICFLPIEQHKSMKEVDTILWYRELREHLQHHLCLLFLGGCQLCLYTSISALCVSNET